MRESRLSTAGARRSAGRLAAGSFREWLLLDEARKASDLARELLGGDESLLSRIQAILPTKVPTKLQGRILALAAFYYADMRVKNLESLRSDIADYARLVNDSKMPVLSVGDDLRVDNPHMSTHLGWSEVVHAKVHEDQARSSPPPQGDASDQEQAFKSEDGRIRVYKSNSVNACIALGQGERFCISQPGNTKFQGYRDTRISTFYFVYDDTRADDLSRVVVDVTRDEVILTDRKNDTGKSIQDPFKDKPSRIFADPNLYFRYLRGKGVDTSVFKNIPKSPAEEAEQAKLGQRNLDKDWFVSLSPEEKSKYIGRGHPLSDAQFQFIWDNKLKNLLAQYVRLGRSTSDYQLDRITSDNDLRKTYLRARLITTRSAGQAQWLRAREYELLSDEQKQSYLEPGARNRLAKALQVGNLRVVKRLIKNEREMERWSLKEGPMDLAIESGNLKLIKYLVELGHSVGEEDVETAAYDGSAEVFEYLVGKLADSTGPSGEPMEVDMADLMRRCEETAARHNNTEVLGRIRDRLSRMEPAAP